MIPGLQDRMDRLDLPVCFFCNESFNSSRRAGDGRVFVITAVFSLVFLYEVPAPRTPLRMHICQGHQNREISESSISKIRTTINPSDPEFRVRRGSNGLTRIRMRVSLAPCDGCRQANTCGRIRHGSRSLFFNPRRILEAMELAGVVPQG